MLDLRIWGLRQGDAEHRALSLLGGQKHPESMASGRRWVHTCLRLGWRVDLDSSLPQPLCFQAQKEEGGPEVATCFRGVGMWFVR
jgi:hypothetical protein